VRGARVGGCVTARRDNVGSSGTPAVDVVVARRFGALLRRWFRANGRDLPWRKTRDPYHILVSELMLQQTQVSRVVTRYAEFIERFPTLHDVARARQHRVT
jgi:A/G-specific adenine glycosylase